MNEYYIKESIYIIEKCVFQGVYAFLIGMVIGRALGRIIYA